MKRSVNILFWILILLSCKKNDNPTEEAKFVSQDTLLKKFLLKEFCVSKREFSKAYINEILEGRYRKEIIIQPGGYKLKYFSLSDAFGYTPFAIRIRDSKDSLVSFFTFTDEMHYLTDNVLGSLVDNNSLEIEKWERKQPDCIVELNLEKKINTLIRQLGYENEMGSIRDLISVVFVDLLNMEEANYYEVKDLVDRLKRIKSHDAEVNACIDEYSGVFRQLEPCRFLLPHAEGGRKWILEILGRARR